MSNASMRWVKVWHEILTDQNFQNLSLEQQARFYNLLVYVSAHGNKGSISIIPPARALLSIMQCENYEIMITQLANLPNILTAKHDNAKFSVSFLNWHKYQIDSTAYERLKKFRKRQNDNTIREDKDKDKDKEKEKEKKSVLHEAKPATKRNKILKLSDEEWMETLKANKAYEGIDIDKLHGRLIAWCELKGKQPTRARLLNWLNREEKPMIGKVSNKPKTSAGIAMEYLKKIKKEEQSNAKTGDSSVINISGDGISHTKAVGR